MNCPACGKKSQYLLDWEFSGFNDSIFNYTADFFECQSCGLAYIENITDKRLAVFYTEECNYFEKAHFDISSPQNRDKYRHYRKFITDAGLPDAPITDVGCGRGGFLFWLENNNWAADCFGVDVDLKSIPNIGKNTCANGGRLTFKEGTAVDLPFNDQTQELLTYFHVLEHIRNIDSVFQEAHRVLNATGHILIEVPDAERYKAHPVGTAFWLSIREHLYHFSACAIYHALRRNAFDVICVNRGLIPTPEFVYPSLMILAGKSHGAKGLTVSKGERIADYIEQSKAELMDQANTVSAICEEKSTLTFWGCSAELFSLLPLLDMKNITLCDSSKLKQKNSYKGIPVEDPAVVQKTGALIVAPYLHGDAIEIEAEKLGWPKDDVFRLR